MENSINSKLLYRQQTVLLEDLMAITFSVYAEAKTRGDFALSGSDDQPSLDDTSFLNHYVDILSAL